MSKPTLRSLEAHLRLQITQKAEIEAELDLVIEQRDRAEEDVQKLRAALERLTGFPRCPRAKQLALEVLTQTKPAS